MPGCGKKLQLVKMRMHVGKNILNGDISGHPNLCRYSGKRGYCTIGLEKRSRFGTGATYGP